MKRYLLYTTALLALAACNKDGTLPEGSDAPVEIRLKSSIEAQTRATHGLDTQLAEGETVHVWVDDAGTGDSVYEGRQLTADGSGALSGEAMYYPSSRNAVNIYGIHGNFGDQDLSASFWGSTVTHTVETDQLSTGTGYAVSDLVYGKSSDVERTTETVGIKLDHLLSKIEVVLVQGSGNPVADKVEILNTRLQAALTPDKENGIAIEAAGSTGTIEIDHGIAESGESDVLNEAVIVPQTIPAGTQLFHLTTDQGGELYYTTDSDTEFESGKKYRYTVTLSLTELSVTTEISNWTDGDLSGTGSATFGEETIITYKTDLSTAKAGDLLTNSGYLIDVDDVDKLTEANRARVVAVVFKAGHQDTDTDYTDTGIGQAECHGYAVALNDAHEEAGAWGIRLNTSESDIAGMPNEGSYTDKYNGYSNTQIVYALDEFASTDVTDPTAEGQYWSFRVVYEYSVAAPASSSGWYLPSIGQLSDIYNLWIENPTLFTSVGGTDFITDTYDGRYWSSTEKNNYDAWYYQFNGNGAASYAKGNTEGIQWLNSSASYVRAVLSF